MSASASAAPPPPKSAKTLACVHCQYRKIKCDRRQPCSNCVKAKVACKPSTPAPPHKRRRPNQDLLERLARCEQLLKQYADGNVPIQGEAAPAPTDPNSGSSQLGSASAPRAETDIKPTYKPAGKVVEEDGNVRFMDNFIRISFHDELIAMRNILDDDDQESEPSTIGLSPENNADLFLGVEDAAVDLQELQPDLVNVIRLWQLFLDRVNPLTKILHVPSVQPIIMDAAADINKVSLTHQALLFSIYTMTVVSLTNQEVVQYLGLTREDALNRFTRGTKLALTRSNFLKSYDMTTLQALSLYMLSLNGRGDNHSNWIMGGTVLRIAQKMGYHRDGGHFNLTPFETEMRRRLWWHVLTQDSKHAMLSGLNQSWVPSNWDTKLPQNLNDADLFPNSLEPLVPREGPTEMAFILLIYQYQEFMLATHGAFEAAFMALRSGGKREPHGQTRGPIETYRALVEEIDVKLAKFEAKYVDPAAGGVQDAASMVRPLFVEKVRNMTIPMYDQPEWGTEIFDPVDSLFKSFIHSHSQNAAIYKRMAKTGFLWYIRAGFQLDALLIFTSKLYKRPTGKLTDRAWTALESIHDLHPDLFDVSQKKIDRQAQFTIKAWAVREQALAQCGKQIEVPEFIRTLRQLVSSPRATSSYTASSGSPASASQQFLLQQTPSYQQIPPDLVDMNQYLGANTDVGTLSVDMWGNLMMDTDAEIQQPILPYGGFDFSKLDFSPTGFTG
ncbi:fungal-specific transcription factor domain-containing protein [Xylariaceae sp. AK1471]|nr:fungal-specific transcription factor domain-containing protein [Xylariaceae sp. AK1471]